jgi:hypothetical protein
MIRSGLLTKAGSAAAALVAGGIFAVASPAQPAVAFFSGGLFLDVVPQSPASLVASGAAVDVTVEITCNANFGPSLYVEVTERVGNNIASGSGSTPISCTGAHQRVVVRVTAHSGKAFAKGKGLATGYLSGCLSPSFVCGEETGSTTVAIRR